MDCSAALLSISTAPSSRKFYCVRHPLYVCQLFQNWTIKLVKFKWFHKIFITKLFIIYKNFIVSDTSCFFTTKSIPTLQKILTGFHYPHTQPKILLCQAPLASQLQTFYPVVKSPRVNVIVEAPLIIRHSTLATLHNQAVLFFSRNSWWSHDFVFS